MRAYMKNDALALSLAGLKSLCVAAQASLRDNAGLAGDAPAVFEAVEYSVSLYGQSFS